MKPMNYVLGALALGCWAANAAADSPYSGAPRHQGAAAGGVITTATPPPGAQFLPGDGGCAPTCDTGCGDCGGIHVYVGGGISYLQPRFKTDPGFHGGIGSLATIEDVNGNPFALAFPNVDRDLNFAYDYELSPRLWAGITVGSGCGFRASWWNIEQDAEKLLDLSRALAGQIIADGDILFFTDGSNFSAFSNLELHVYDFEFTASSDCCGSWMFSCGIRYVDFEQQYSAGINGTLVETFVAGDSLTLTHNELLSVSDKFRALGPTVAVEGRCPICCGCLYVYGMARGSLLVGHGEETARRALARVTTLNDVTTTFSADANTVTDRDDTITVCEFEVGFEAAKDAGSFSGFVRAGVAGQLWNKMRIPNAAALPDGNGQFNGFQILSTRQTGSDDNEMTFFGLVFTAGVRF